MTAARLTALPAVDLSALSHRRLNRMHSAAGDLFDVLETFALEGRHPVRDAIAAPDESFTSAQHYPSADVENPDTGCAWYYHAHSEEHAVEWEEHGHFHCFMYTERLSPSVKPIALPAHPYLQNGGLVHLAAIAFDVHGTPIRLFIPNRWVTDEWLYPARHVIALLDHFSFVGSDPRYALTSRFLTAMLRLFHPQIAAALHERDRAICPGVKDKKRDFTEDRSVPVIASIALDIDSHVAALDMARSSRRTAQRHRSMRVTSSLC